jgi:hypothetical protein
VRVQRSVGIGPPFGNSAPAQTPRSGAALMAPGVRASANLQRNFVGRTLLIVGVLDTAREDRNMVGTSIVAAMETSLLCLQATRVIVMPILALIESTKADRQDFSSCHEPCAVVQGEQPLDFGT